LSADAKRALLAGTKWITIWNTATGQLLRKIDINNRADRMLSVSLSPGGDRVLAMVRGHPSVTVSDVTTGRLLKSFDLTGREFITDNILAFSSDRNSVLVPVSGFVGLWDLTTGAFVRKFAFPTYVHCVAISSDGTRVAVGGDRVTLWDAATGQLLREFHPVGKEGYISALALSPDGTKLMSASHPYNGAPASFDSSMKVWDLATGQLLFDAKGRVRTAAFSSDSKRIGTRYEDTVTLWDVTTGQVVRSIKIGIPEASVPFAMSEDATRFVLGTSYGLTVWSVETAQLLVTLIPSETTDEWIAFTPDGYFDGSKNATDLFTVTRGLDIIDKDQLETTLRRPDLLQQKLKGRPVGVPSLHAPPLSARLAPIEPERTPVENPIVHVPQPSSRVAPHNGMPDREPSPHHPQPSNRLGVRDGVR
jgi:WD40 repeat protein